MERQVRIGQKIIAGPNIDRFALQRVLTSTQSRKEYLIGSEWKEGQPSEKPNGFRVVFDSVEQFRIAKDVYFAWKDIMSGVNAFVPEKPEVSIQRIQIARGTGKPLILFVPWGVRPIGEFGISETRVLRRIRAFSEQLKARNVPNSVMIMPADLYATEVNAQVDPNKTRDYFERVLEEARGLGFIIKLWSEIRIENIDAYNARRLQLDLETLKSLLTPYKVYEAITVSRRRSGYADQEDVERAALAYLRERICEAEIVEQVYQPIKLSAVSKHKDNRVDRDLPRLYIVPDSEQFPWLK